MSVLFDPGLQPERTELAWRRTMLSLAVGSLVAMRLLPAVFGHAIWIIPGVLGLVAAGVLALGARRRYRTGNSLLLADGHRPKMPGAGLLLALASTATLIGITGVIIAIAVTTAI